MPRKVFSPEGETRLKWTPFTQQPWRYFSICHYIRAEQSRPAFDCQVRQLLARIVSPKGRVSGTGLSQQQIEFSRLIFAFRRCADNDADPGFFSQGPARGTRYSPLSPLRIWNFPTTFPMARTIHIQSGFLPSPGQFIKWCREGRCVLGIITADLMAEYWKWRKLVFRYPSSEQYLWQKPVYYHICLELRCRGTDGQLSLKELENEAGNILDMWEKRVLAGKPIPPVRRALSAPVAAKVPTPAQILFAMYTKNKGGRF